ncbi:YheC/YheD family protein [Cohnella panacarvi]|uniref:YheC/YheD family protein n=1 Tax=Cohnella panacarvi TaxID=400776 RepID=UPI000479D46E|nr:YheC/YheD family protein [Cohnella panacarvi]
MRRYASKHLTNKWLKTKAIARDAKVRGWVPETRLMNLSSLRAMLRRYGMVYVKPVSGTYGRGVMRVEAGIGAYTYQVEQTKRSFATVEDLYRSITRHKLKRSYLVQRGIRLLKYKGRRFDIRVMVQRNLRGRWETTGIIGRVAHPRKIVTNYHSGGKPTALQTLLAPLSTKTVRARIERRIASVGYNAAVALNRAYPTVNMVGADIGLDTSFRPWIIELNTAPDPYLFRFLKDKRIHRKVLRYARALGRIPPTAKSRRRR